MATTLAAVLATGKPMYSFFMFSTAFYATLNRYTHLFYVYGIRYNKWMKEEINKRKKKKK